MYLCLDVMGEVGRNEVVVCGNEITEVFVHGVLCAVYMWCCYVIIIRNVVYRKMGIF